MTLFSEKSVVNYIYNTCIITYIICIISYILTHILVHTTVQFSLVTQSCLTLRPYELQHTRPPCPSPLLEFTQTHVHGVSDAIQASHPLLSPSPPAPNPSQHQGLFQ